MSGMFQIHGSTMNHNPPLLFTQLISLSSASPLKLPASAAEWEEDDTSLTNTLIPAVLQAQCVEDKNKILCEGIYGYFVSKYETIQINRNKVCSVQHPRKHNRAVKRITKEKNMARGSSEEQ